MKRTGHLLLPWVLGVVFLLTRILPVLWPGSLPPNFSAAYAFTFCSGVFLAGRAGWALPLSLLFASDLVINLYYGSVKNLNVWTLAALVYVGFNYLGHLLLLALGRLFKNHRSYLALLGGGLLGAIAFYLITNTASWLFNPFNNPEYTRDLAGWITALTFGTKNHPPTWEFFRNTLLSGGLFTSLFTAAWKLTNEESPAEKGEEPEATTPADPQPQPEEANA